MSGRDTWHTASQGRPCPLCTGEDWCRISSDERAVLCGRVEEVPHGWRATKTAKDGRTVYTREDGRGRRSGTRARRPAAVPDDKPLRDWSSLAKRCRATLESEQRDRLAADLGVAPTALDAIGAGWAAPEVLGELRAGGGEKWSSRAGAFTVPERNGSGRVIGVSLRAPSGAKGFPSGAKRGLVIPDGLADMLDPVLVVEGASDVGAALTIGLAAAGRPSNLSGGDDLTKLLRGRECIVLGEHDSKPDGKWPGRDGAQQVAGALASAWRKGVRWALPPDDAKDIRSWLVAQQLDIADTVACREAGARLLAVLEHVAETVRPVVRVHLRKGPYGRHDATVAVGSADAPRSEDVLHVGRLRVGETGDRDAFVSEATSEVLKVGATADDIGAALDEAIRARTATSFAPVVEDEASTAELVVQLAEERYRFGISDEGEPFAVEHEGPNVALSLRGSASTLRARLAHEFRGEHGRTPNSSALTDALTVLAGEAQDQPRETVHLRCARRGTDLVIDLGDDTGRAIAVDRDGWRVLDRSPMLFRRTALTGPMPQPVRGGDLSQLRTHVAITSDDWPLLVGWIVHALIPDEPHAILLLGGTHGGGKTTTAERIVSLVDPSRALTRAEPRDARQLVIAAAASRAICIDNISSVPVWLSDALCRIATGAGWCDRALYTDSDVAVLEVQRAVLLTSIDPGALRGDLGDRILMADLEGIPEESRRPKHDMDEAWDMARPRILGAVLDLLARVLGLISTTTLDRMPRMADFARILAAVDRALGTDGLARLEAQSRRVAQDVVDGDQVAAAILAFARDRGPWVGTAAELLTTITAEGRPPRGWPTTPRVLGVRLRRAAPSLRELGVEVVAPAPHARPRTWTIRTVSPTDSPPGKERCPPADGARSLASVASEPSRPPVSDPGGSILLRRNPDDNTTIVGTLSAAICPEEAEFGLPDANGDPDAKRQPPSATTQDSFLAVGEACEVVTPTARRVWSIRTESLTDGPPEESAGVAAEPCSRPSGSSEPSECPVSRPSGGISSDGRTDGRGPTDGTSTPSTGPEEAVLGRLDGSDGRDDRIQPPSATAPDSFLAQAQDPGPNVISRPDRPCRTCRTGTRFWRLAGGRWTCHRCHPPAVPEAVVEDLDLTEALGPDHSAEPGGAG